mmetsp:Transcript_3120/g.6289  ORF Transcript_3120/g.6289 Transcript_3120/m.6289 type:complete len:148 (+) Transcript_3120:466-909(+)
MSPIWHPLCRARLPGMNPLMMSFPFRCIHVIPAPPPTIDTSLPSLALTLLSEEPAATKKQPMMKPSIAQPTKLTEAVHLALVARSWRGRGLLHCHDAAGLRRRRDVLHVSSGIRQALALLGLGQVRSRKLLGYRTQWLRGHLHGGRV